MQKSLTPQRCSIIIPAFNVERYAAEAMESAVGQTYPDVEVIVVDDGSTDGTGRVLDSFVDRAIVLRQANRGAAAARNAAIAASTGGFLAFLDGDDRWSPDRVDRCIDLLERGPADAVTTDAVLFDDTGELGLYYDDADLRAGFAAEDQAAALVALSFVFGAVVVRRSVLPPEPIFDDALGGAEDYDLWLRLAAAGVRFHLIDEPLAGYRMRPGSCSQHPDRHRFHMRALAKTAPTLANRLEPPWARHTYQAARVAFDDGDRHRAALLLRLTAGDPSLARHTRLKIRARALVIATGATTWRRR